MLKRLRKPQLPGAGAEGLALVAALNQSHAVIWFAPDGTILDANPVFLDLMGYELSEIQGQHHRMFMVPAERDTADYDAFWASLRAGDMVSDRFSRRKKNGEEVWLEATYHPVRGEDGRVERCVKIASDVSRETHGASEATAIRTAVSQAQAVIEFDLDGTILTANENFLSRMGYELSQIVGKTHRIFVDPVEAESEAYAAFWAQLKEGRFQTGEFRRHARDGSPVWLQASYTPILDPRGVPYRVMKFASDITDQKVRAQITANQIAAIAKSQACIEFDLDGIIVTANDLFLQAVGYDLDQIVGQHHRMFVPPDISASENYNAMWRDLRAGEYQSGEFRRINSQGDTLWLNASYNPILDLDGTPVKIVKYAVDITPRKQAVEALREAIGRLSGGDLTCEITRQFADEYDELRIDFNAAMVGLSNAMDQVVGTAGQLRQGTGEISQASEDLAHRAERQASTLEETAAALEELTASVNTASQAAGQARDTVARTRDQAKSGAQTMHDAVAAMDAISQSSAKIRRITDVIEEIAFQTNLLALNAGVEAARAGDAGRGFAVVASEVRALAVRSSDAATEISDLIAQSAEQVSHGVDLVAKTREALSQIEGHVEDATERVSQIATSSSEQADAVSEINLAVGDLDGVTQSNAAMFEETRAATQQLVHEIEGLLSIVAVFETGGPAAGADLGVVLPAGDAEQWAS